MGTFDLRVETDNAAFTDDPGGELARILRALADRLDQHGLTAQCVSLSGAVRDVNGNSVGGWDYVRDTACEDCGMPPGMHEVGCPAFDQDAGHVEVDADYIAEHGDPREET